MGSSRETHIFETVQVLVTFAARLTVKRLFLFHTQGTRIGSTRLWVDNGECAVAVLV